MRDYLMPMKIVHIKKYGNSYCKGGCGEKNSNVVCLSLYEEQYEDLSKTGIKILYKPEIPILASIPNTNSKEYIHAYAHHCT